MNNTKLEMESRSKRKQRSTTSMVVGGSKGIAQKGYNMEGCVLWVGLASTFSSQKKPVWVNGN